MTGRYRDGLDFTAPSRNVRAMKPVVEPFDPATLNRLLVLAGPDLAGELQRRLLADLTAVADRMAAARQDCASVQAQCHVLIALAGTAGATALHADADQLHQMALSRDKAGMAALLPKVLRATLGLTRAIAGVRQP